MIPIEVLKRVSVVYVHAQCPDGLASAMILKDAFRMLGTSPRIEFLVHNSEAHRQAALDVRDPDVALFCDMAPCREVWTIHRYECDVIVLDHHKGAEEIVRSFVALGVFADEKLEPGVSGAVLAWREVWNAVSLQVGPLVSNGSQRKAVREFAECIGARDTWQTQDPRFQRGQWISKLLMSKPASYWLEPQDEGDGIEPHRCHPLYFGENEVLVGQALFEAHEESVRQAVAQCVYYLVPNETNAAERLGRRVCMAVFQEQACGFRLTSDVAEALRQVNAEPRPEDASFIPVDLVVGFSFVSTTAQVPNGDVKLVFSLRGLNGFDVCAFAKANGGGGHTAAAGFSIPIDELVREGTTPYTAIRRRLAHFLGAE